MRKLFLFVAGILSAATLFAQTEQAQTKSLTQYLSLGPVVDLGHNWVGNTGGTSRFMPSGGMGVGLIYAEKAHWGWGGQLLFTSEGYNIDYPGNHNAMMVPIYLRMPLNAYYFFGHYKDRVRPKLYAGPVFGLRLAQQDDRDPVSPESYMNYRTGEFRTFDFGLHAGGGLNIQIAQGTWLNLDLVYYQGLTDAVKDPAGQNNVNHNLGASAGILFGVR